MSAAFRTHTCMAILGRARAPDARAAVFELQYRTFSAVTLHEVYRFAARAIIEI